MSRSVKPPNNQDVPVKPPNDQMDAMLAPAAQAVSVKPPNKLNQSSAS
jgi:hypothetical protein